MTTFINMSLLMSGGNFISSCVRGTSLASFPDNIYVPADLAKSSLGTRLEHSYDFLPYRTALHWACKRGHLSVVRYLLQNGAEANITSHKGELPVDVAATTDVAKLLSGKECAYILKMKLS